MVTIQGRSGMRIQVECNAEGFWVCSIWNGLSLVYLNSAFSSYDRAERDAQARLSELERLATAGG